MEGRRRVKKWQQPDDAAEGSPQIPPIKITVNLSPKTSEALERASKVTASTKTDCINRAVQMFDWVQDRMKVGDQPCVIDRKGRVREIHMF